MRIKEVQREIGSIFARPGGYGVVFAKLNKGVILIKIDPSYNLPISLDRLKRVADFFKTDNIVLGFETSGGGCCCDSIDIEYTLEVRDFKVEVTNKRSAK